MDLRVHDCLNNELVMCWKFGHGSRVATWLDSNSAHDLTHLPPLDPDQSKNHQRFRTKPESKLLHAQGLLESNTSMDQKIM